MMQPSQDRNGDNGARSLDGSMQGRIFLQCQVRARLIVIRRMDKNAILPIDAAIQSNLRETTTRVLASLTPREERILRMRFGIGMNSDHTLEEVGQQFSVTRERIRQIEAKALRKLKHPSRSRVLRTSSIIGVPGRATSDKNAMIIGRVQQGEFIRLRARLPLRVICDRSIQRQC